MGKFFHHTKNRDSVTPLTPKKGSPKKSIFSFFFWYFWTLITLELIKIGKKIYINISKVLIFHHTKNQDSVTPLTPKKGPPKKSTFFVVFLFFWKPITFEPIKLGVCNLISLKLGSSSFTIPKMKILWPL